MSPVELIALSLALSIAFAVIAGLAAAGLERATTDPTLRERAWAWALYLPALPPLAVAATLLTPVPVRPTPSLPGPALPTETIDTFSVAVAPVTPVVVLDLGQIALAALLLAVLLTALRLASLAQRGWRLKSLMARTEPASSETWTVVDECAAHLAVASPAVRTGLTARDALLAGLKRPVLILPRALAEAPDTPATRSVIAHELAHLKRGDHRAIWIEEAVVALLAINPILPLIRAQRAAAREEACDVLALAGAEVAARRAYASSLIEALRVRTDPTILPALTFNGSSRSQAMRRLKSILTPPATAGRGTYIAAVSVGVGLVAASGLASAALASQREVVLVPIQVEGQHSGLSSRYLEASARDGQMFCAAPVGDRDRTFGCDAVIWAAAEREAQQRTGSFCAPPTKDVAGLEAIATRARPFVLTSRDTSGSARDGARRALTTAFPCEGEAPQPTAFELDAVQTRLNAEWIAQHAARSTTETAARAAQMQAQTPADIKRECVAGHQSEAGCDGMIFGYVIAENQKLADSRLFCAPEAIEEGPELARRAKATIARTAIRYQESRQAFLTRALAETYPCGEATPSISADAPEEAARSMSPVQQTGLLRPLTPPARPQATRVSLRLEFPSQYRAQAGDRLDVTFSRPGQPALSRTMSIALEPGLLPQDIITDMEAGYFEGRDAPSIRASVISERGIAKARQSDRARPMIVRADREAAAGVLSLVGTSALRQARVREQEVLPQRSRSLLPRITGDRWPSPASRPEPLSRGRSTSL